MAKGRRSTLSERRRLHSLEETKYFIHKVASQQCSKVPIRMYDTLSRRFISRGELCEEVELLTFEGFEEYSTAQTPLEATEDEDPSKFVLRWALRDDECHEIKRLVLLHTRYAILSHTWGKNELSYEAVRKGFPESVEASNLSNDDTLTNNPILNSNSKFSGFLRAAKNLGCRYLWLDTACIDKTSSAELDESIRSMFTWYRVAFVCIVYLDTEGLYDCLVARWFKRGWTLQEVLASKRLVFFQCDWKRVFAPHGLETPFVTNNDISGSLRRDTHTAFTRNNRCFDVVRKFGLVGYDAHEPEIDVDFYDDHCTEDEAANNKAIIDELVEYHHLGLTKEDMTAYHPSPNQARTIFRYMRHRSTTVPEDAAYCLLGLLGIVIPPSYGEGKEHALYRLQVACTERTNERNIFWWDDQATKPSQFNSMLPRNPFAKSWNLPRYLGTVKAASITATGLWDPLSTTQARSDTSFTFTNAGLRIPVILHGLSFNEELRLTKDPKGAPKTMTLHGSYCERKLAVLGTYTTNFCPLPRDNLKVFAIVVERVGEVHSHQYRQVPGMVQPDLLPPIEDLRSRAPETIYII